LERVGRGGFSDGRFGGRVLVRELASRVEPIVARHVNQKVRLDELVRQHNASVADAAERLPEYASGFPAWKGGKPRGQRWQVRRSPRAPGAGAEARAATRALGQ
jgi:hypothetical protein